MSIPLAPTTLTPGTPVNIQVKTVSSIQALKLSNGTPYDLTISGFGVVGQEIVPAGTEYMLYAERENRGTLAILPVDNSAVGGTAVINIVTYLNDEPLPKGSWPVAIPTQKVTAKVTSVNRLTSIGESVGTQIINLQPAGDAASCVTLTNSGVLVIGDATNPGSVSFDNAKITSDGGGTLTVAKLVDNGTLSVTGTSTFTGDATFNGAGTGVTITNNALISGTETVTGDASFNGAIPSINALHGVNFGTPGDTYYLASSGTTIVNVDVNNKNLSLNAPNVGSGGKISFQVGGVELAFLDGTNLNLVHSLNLVVGSLGQLSTFSGTGNGTVATGVTNPTAIAFDDCTLSGSSQTLGGTVASSSVVTTGAGLAWRGTAWHN